MAFKRHRVIPKSLIALTILFAISIAFRRRISVSRSSGNCPEWAVVEVQGVVEAQPGFQDRLQNLEIGRLCRPSSQEIYTFTVGYHELTGSKVMLKKPLLVLKKVKKDDIAEQGASTRSPGVELDVIGIIRQKILFKTRPKAIISKPQPAVRERGSACISAASNN